MSYAPGDELALFVEAPGDMIKSPGGNPGSQVGARWFMHPNLGLCRGQRVYAPQKKWPGFRSGAEGLCTPKSRPGARWHLNGEL
jgi:hypothetical protein